MGRLSGKVALVTGGAVGIGAACVAAHDRVRRRVVIVDLHDDAGQKLAGSWASNARYFHADVSVEAEVGSRDRRYRGGVWTIWTSWSTTPASPAPTSRPTN